MLLFLGMFISLAFLVPLIFAKKESTRIDEPQMEKLLRDAIRRAEHPSERALGADPITISSGSR